MQMIDVDYNVRVGYWASRNNVEEYKVYVIVIQMFNLNFMNNLWQDPSDNPWLEESTNHNYKTHVLHQTKYLLGMNHAKQSGLIEAS
jgi:hypothetical protein